MREAAGGMIRERFLQGLSFEQRIQGQSGNRAGQEGTRMGWGSCPSRTAELSISL